MPSKRAEREYRGKACIRCHKLKVKCTREIPCRNCALANRQCVYAVRDRKVTVPESYLKRLENAVNGSGASPDHAAKRPRLDPGGPSPGLQKRGKELDEDAEPIASRRLLDPLVENSTAELFVSRLRQIQKSKPPSGTFGTLLESIGSADGDSKRGGAQAPTYEYFALNSDTLHAKCTFNLPPYPYAQYLLTQFSTYLGGDWHWFRERNFLRRVDNIYMTTDSAESKDRVFLCQLLLVFSLSLSFNGEEPEIRLDLSGHATPSAGHSETAASSPPPGTEFFEQALGLLKVPYEEVSVEHIETVNLASLCSYALNRQKTAYMYAGQSCRMCNMLQLHKVSVSEDCSPMEQEHRKRIWWSTFCIDRMASTQTGLMPALQADQGDLELPTDIGLSPDDAEEFSDAAYLSARVQLTIMQAENASNVCNLGHDDAKDIETILRPMLRRLQNWWAGLPAHIAFGLEDGVPDSMRDMPRLRSLANTNLRFNQCLILLLRPLLLRQIACIFSNEESNASQEDLRDLNDACLRSARSSVRILIDLRTCCLLVRRGLMENMHLFTSLMILSLAMSINARHPHSFDLKPDDAITYEAGKDVLRDMVQGGSLAAKGHESMLSEVEALGRSIEMDGATEGVDLMVEPWDIDEWMTQLFEGENMLDLF